MEGASENLVHPGTYECIYCGRRFVNFTNIIEHCTSEHKNKNLEVCQLVLSEETGQFVYLSKDFKITPEVQERNGHTICVNEERQSICLKDNVGSVCSGNPFETADPVPLDSDEEENELQEEITRIQNMLPITLLKMKVHGFLTTWILLHELIVSGKFSFTNIAFKLFMDFVRYLGCGNPHSMRYSPDVRNFWTVGYKLFHGRFLRYMGGSKNQGQVVSGTATHATISGEDSNINFAVPSTSVLKPDLGFEQHSFQPGVIQECIEEVGKKKKQVKICFDGKRINSSFTSQHGDVNLFGFEAPPTLQNRIDRKNEEISALKEMAERANQAKESDKHVSDIKDALFLVSRRIKELREMAAKKQEAVQKLRALAGPDWRKCNKYSFVLSSLESSLYEIQQAINSSLQTNEELCKTCAELQGVSTNFSSESIVDLSNQANYVCLTAREEDRSTDTESGYKRHLVKQKSEEWFKVRESARVTGSTAHSALGLATLKEQVAHYDEVIHGKKKKPHSEITLRNMEHGTVNEVNALATLVCKVLPVFYPKLKFVEEGCISVWKGGTNLLTVSPDGSGRSSPEGPAVCAFEFKCPTEGKRFSPQVHYRIHERYIIQLMAEMAALKCSKLLFISWTKQSSTIFEVDYSETLWDMIWNEMDDLYGEDKPKRPARVRPVAKTLREEIRRFAEDNVKFLCELSSVMATSCSHTDEDTNSSQFFRSHGEESSEHNEVPSLNTQVFFRAQHCIEEAYQLTRQRATEIFIFMLSDLDRQSSSQSPHSLPVAYGLQGASLTVETVKQMLVKVLEAADAEGLDPLFFACDGQWAKLIDRDLQGKPLTKIQLQKQFWEKVNKMSKDDVLKCITDMSLKEMVPGAASTLEIPMQAVHLKRRHMLLMSSCKNRSRSDCPQEASSDDTDTAANAEVLGLLPIGLVEKVDPDTYKEIVMTIGSLLTKETVAEETDEQPDMVIDHCDPQHPITEGEKGYIQLEQKHLEIIISAMRADEKVGEKWKVLTETDLKNHLRSATLGKDLKLQEVKVVLKTVKQLFPEETTDVRLSVPKWKLVCSLANLLGLSCIIEHTSKQKTRGVPSLKDLSYKQAKKLPKSVLCAVYAEIKFPQEEQEWLRSFPFSPSSTIDGNIVSWHSFPAMRITADAQRTMPLFGIIDSHHILTNLRSKVCTSGIEDRGISRDAWVKVARSEKDKCTGLTIAHVEDLIDKQSNAYAQLTFSQKVEEAMRANGNNVEADFCNLVRSWYEAEDAPGLSCHVRLENRLRMREWLLAGYNCEAFPPPTQYIRGVPMITFMALLTNIERKIQAYAVVDRQSYNPRSLSTLDAENFFSVLGDYVPSAAKLAIRPADIPAALKTACEISVLQMNPSRAFHMHVSRAPVYPTHEMEVCPASANEDDTIMPSRDGYTNPMTVITMNDHVFDQASRRRRQGKRKSALLSGPSCPSKGAQGVRQYHRTDESKILPHIRLGLNITN